MVRRRRNEIMVGAVVLAGILLFSLMLFMMGSLDGLLRPTAVVHATFDDVSSLQIGDAVYLHGMKVGKVESVRLRPRQGDETVRVEVAMGIPRTYRPYLREDSSVVIDKSVTGIISVLIGGGEGAELPDGVSLAGSKSFNLMDTGKRVDAVLAAMKKAVDNVNRLMMAVQSDGDLKSTIEDAGALVKQVREDWPPLQRRLTGTLEEIRALAADNRLDLRQTMTDLKAFAGRAREVASSLQETPKKINDGLDEVKRAGASLSEAIRDNREHIDTALEDFSRSASNASNLTADLQRRPWLIFHKPSAADLETLQLYDAAWAYNLGATELYRSIRSLTGHLQKTRSSDEGESGEEEKEALQLALERVRDSLEKQRQAEDLFWERLKKLE